MATTQLSGSVIVIGMVRWKLGVIATSPTSRVDHLHRRQPFNKGIVRGQARPFSLLAWNVVKQGAVAHLQKMGYIAAGPRISKAGPHKETS